MSNQPTAVEAQQEPTVTKSAKLKKLFTKNRVQHLATATIAAGATLILVSRLKDRNEQADSDEGTDAPVEA